MKKSDKSKDAGKGKNDKVALRKERKYEREKKKRDIVAGQFDEIAQLLNMNLSNVDRTQILETLLKEIEHKKKLKAQAQAQMATQSQIFHPKQVVMMGNQGMYGKQW
mmetsp:Transcript_16950/g.31200  ORF Transcript_16950/g.31200 Transcript_16950/m.31200 type:complete len:107 (-) Transcript_16950:154-474(-)